MSCKERPDLVVCRGIAVCDERRPRRDATGQDTRMDYAFVTISTIEASMA